MARHWSAYTPTVSEKQAIALDRMAKTAGLHNGMDLLMKLSGYSSSKVQKLDRPTMRELLDRAFAEYGRR